MMRRARPITAIVCFSAIISFASATPAGAQEPPSNFGNCVSTDVVDPAQDPWGPFNLQAAEASSGTGNFGAAIINSDGAAAFPLVATCGFVPPF